MKNPSATEIQLLALIAFRAGEISEGRACELAGCSRNTLRDAMFARVGKFSPYNEACAERDLLLSKLKAIRAHWVEFGPEHGFNEVIDPAYKTISEMEKTI